MAQPYDINMPNLLNYYNAGVDRARANVKYAQEQEALRQEAEKNAFVAAAYRRNYDPATGRVNQNALMGELARQGYGADIPAYTQTYQELEKGRIANFAEELKNQKDLLAGVSDQASWDAWSANARTRLGPEVGKFIPAQFSEEAKRKLMQDADKQYEQIYREVDLSGRKEIIGSPVYGPPSATPVYTGQVTVSPDEASRAARDRGTRPLGFREVELQLPTGEVVPGVFDPNSAQYGLYTPQGLAPLPPGTRPVTASTNTGYIGAVQKGAAERDVAAYNAAKAAQVGLIKDYETLDLLESGEPATGLFGEAQLFVDRVLAEFDGDSKAARRASDTQLLNALLGSDVFANIQALGIGARGLDTPAEREFLREVVSGTTKLTPDTLRRMANLRVSIKERAIKEFNRRVEAGELDVFLRASGLPKETIPLPSRQKRGAGADPYAGISDEELLRMIGQP